MRILLVNKFLYPNGGSETYVFELGKYLTAQGHQVEYFGMEHPNRCVGNSANAYTSTMDFHAASGLKKLTYAYRTIYSKEARQKLRLVLDSFQPEVVHLNNFNYQLTPSLIVEVLQYRKDTGKPCALVYTAHDFQLICPNHALFDQQGRVCERCLGTKKGRFLPCVKGKCIHGSTIRSVLGFLEATYWNGRSIYEHLDAIICPSKFMKQKLDTNPVLARKTVFLRNFSAKPAAKGDTLSIEGLPEKYVLYFGRFSEEKGMGTLLKAAQALPKVPFVAAGSGPLEGELVKAPNIQNVGFQSGGALVGLIEKAAFSVIPSEWFENCPYSIIESLMLGTPVLGARIGGIPELIDDGRTGELFESGNAADLTAKIAALWENEGRYSQYRRNCLNTKFDGIEEYAGKLLKIYAQ